MIVTACLAWYDEPVETLERCVRSCAVLADRVLAVDGGYARFPGARISSPGNQAEAIQAAAAAAGLACEVVTPTGLWAGQVEKRANMLGRGIVGSDFVMSVDADYLLRGTRERIRAALEASDADVFDVRFFTPENPDRPITDSAAHTWHAELAGNTVHEALLYRALPQMRVERFHYWVSALKDGERVWLWGDAPAGRHLPIAPVPGDLRVDHMALHRDEAHVLANRAFCNDRELVVRLTGQEDDQPGLPAPQWDYSRLGGTNPIMVPQRSASETGSSYRNNPEYAR